MKKLSGAEMVVQSLRDQGVEFLFGYPGGAVLDIYDAIHTLGGIEHILVRHEQAAVHMADGYARATGKVGCVLVTSGPGATNAITGIATAYADSIPLVVLSGQVPSGLIGSDAFQECDMIGISRPVVKHSFLVKNSEDIPTIIKKAFYIGKKLILEKLKENNIEILEVQELNENTGNELFLSVNSLAEKIKNITVAIEESCELGRLFDIDVIDVNFEKLSRKSFRKCLICEEQSQECGRSRKHSVKELQDKIEEILSKGAK